MYLQQQIYFKVAQIPGTRFIRLLQFCMVVSGIGGSLLWNLLHVTPLAHRILRWLLGKFVQP